MVSVEEAKELLLGKVKLLPSVKKNITESVNSILAEDVRSPVDLPPFKQSAMDGFAIKFKDRGKTLRIVGEIKAGDKKLTEFSDGETVRILTGAAVPDSADCIVMQEKTVIENNCLTIHDPSLKKHDNIRPVGSDIKKGELALKKGSILRPAAIGFLAGMGIRKTAVYKQPEVSIIVTGNELKSSGVLKKGEIYESNSFALEACLNQMNIYPKNIFRVKDKKDEVLKTIKQALSSSDFVLISGGISVGKYDLVKESLERTGVKEIFYKVKQKPGKPLFAGFINKGKKGKEEKIVFALPGNPAATLVCFYEYVFPSVRKAMGYTEFFLPSKKLKLLNPGNKKNERALFLKGRLSNDGVISLDGQGSYMMRSFAEADALIYLPAGEEMSGLKEVEVHLLKL